MTTVEQAVPQPMAALAVANQTRLACAAVKREIRAGQISVAEALADERSASLTVVALLVAQRRWGRERAVKALRGAMIPEIKRVGALTIRQRGVLVEACVLGSRSPAVARLSHTSRSVLGELVAERSGALHAADLAERLRVDGWTLSGPLISLRHHGLIVQGLDGWAVTTRGREEAAAA